MSAETRTEVRLLGPVEVTIGGRAVALGGPKQRAVLAMLALQPNVAVSADRLVEGLWGEHPPRTAPKMLQLYVSHLRKLLNTGDAQIVTRAGGYELRAAHDAVDAVRLASLVERAARADGAADAPARQALALWRGPPLDDIADEPFAAREIRRLEDLWLNARELAIDGALADGHHAAVLAELDELVAAHPLREGLHAQRMLALYACGRQAEALGAYRDARDLLVQEVGVEPGPGLRRVHEAILRQDPALAGPARPLAAPAVRARRRPVLAAAALLAGAGIVGLVLILVVAQRGGSALAEDSVGLIDAGGAIRQDYKLGHKPGAVVASGGSLWIVDSADGTLTRLERDRSRATTIDVGADPTAVAAGARSIWVANGQPRTISQIDPGSNKVVQRIDVGGQPASLAVGAGAIWAGMPLEGEIVRVGLSGDTRRRRVALGGAPGAVAVGAGAVWVADQDTGRVVRVDPRSLRPTTAINVGNGPVAVAIGAGAVWVANRSDGTVSRIDPRTLSVTATVKVGAEAAALAVGRDAVWVADAAGLAVARLDAAGRLTRRIRTATSPSGLAADGRSVWATAIADPQRHRGGTLRVEAAPCAYTNRCADPAFAHPSAFDMLTLAYDGLVGYRRAAGGAGAVLVGALATEVPQPTDAGRRYTFMLRPNLRYSDGRPVRASDFGASLERMLRLNGRGNPDYYSAVVGAAACLRAPSRCDLSRGIVADDATRAITIHLSRPDADLPHKLALPLASLLAAGGPRGVVENSGPPGTGPYRIATVDADGNARLVRNTRFTGRPAADRPAGFPDEIVIRRPADLERRLAAVEHDQADIVAVEAGGAQLPIARLRGLLTARSGHVSVAPMLVVDTMFLNVRTPPFDDIRVRRAVNLAVDRARMVQLGGGAEAAEVACQELPPTLPGYIARCPFTVAPDPAGTWKAPDVPAARRLIAASGTRGRRVHVWTDTSKARFGSYFAELLRRLGYRTRLRVLPVGFDYYRTIGDSRTRAQIGWFGWAADFPTPSTFFDPILSCRGRQLRSPENLNVSQLCDRALDRAVQQAQAAGGVGASWVPAQRRLIDLAPTVPLISRRHIVLSSDRAGNVEQHPLWTTLLERVWVR